MVIWLPVPALSFEMFSGVVPGPTRLSLFWILSKLGGDPCSLCRCTEQ